MGTQTRPKNWLDTAASYASTKWLAKFIRFHLAQLEAGSISAAEFADELEQEFDSRRLTKTAQQKNYRSNVVMALKQLDPQHPAIELVTLSTEQYRILNDEQRGRLADRETRFIHHEVVDTLVEMATNLLSSEEWSDVGAGLAVLVGRRISEIIFAGFALKSPWSLAFSQMAKKPEAIDITIEIPTLAPALIVLDAIERLQEHLGADLDSKHISQRDARRIANSRYSGAITHKCQDYFSGLVPNRSDKDNLYTHIFRAVYATIAAHWYCPPNIPEHQFKSEIQGHFTLTQDGKKLPNYSARSNYDDYAIGDGNGNRDGRLGIKLGHVEGLQVIEAFRHQEEKGGEEALAKPLGTRIASEEEPTTRQIEHHLDLAAKPAALTEDHRHPRTDPMPSTTAERTMKRPMLYAEDLELMQRLMAERQVTGNPAEVFRALLETFITETQATKRQEVATLSDFAQTLNWFTNRVSQLEQERDQLQQEHEHAQTQPQDTHEQETEIAQLRERSAQLEERNAQLEQELEATQSRLDRIHSLLGGNGSSSDTPQTTKTTDSDQNHRTASTAIAEPATIAKKRDSNDSITNITAIVDAIIQWNKDQERSERRLQISFPSVKSLAVLMGSGSQPAIREVMEQKAAEIDAVHQRFMMGSRHNRSVRDKDGVLKAIAREYLKLSNWDDAQYNN